MRHESILFLALGAGVSIGSLGGCDDEVCSEPVVAFPAIDRCHECRCECGSCATTLVACTKQLQPGIDECYTLGVADIEPKEPGVQVECWVSSEYGGPISECNEGIRGPTLPPAESLCWYPDIENRDAECWVVDAPLQIRFLAQDIDDLPPEVMAYCFAGTIDDHVAACEASCDLMH